MNDIETGLGRSSNDNCVYCHNKNSESPYDCGVRSLITGIIVLCRLNGAQRHIVLLVVLCIIDLIIIC